jgi:hypothetical protein
MCHILQQILLNVTDSYTTAFLHFTASLHFHCEGEPGIYIGIYIDGIIYFSSSDKVE